jgi:lambda family phage tail tape measure protein
MDLASLGVKVTSTGVDESAKKLDNLATSSQKAEASTAKLAKTSSTAFQTVGESADGASTRIKDMVKASLAQVDAQAASTSSAKAYAKAQTDVSGTFDRIVTAQNKAMAATTGLVAAQEKANAAAKNSASIKEQAADLSKLVGQIDPAVAALGRLDKQQEKLVEFKKSGAIGADDFKAYSASIDASRAKITGASDAVHGFSLNNANARRELGLLAKDLATGQWGHFEQSAATLASSSGLMAAAFSATGIAIAGAAGELAIFGAAAYAGYADQQKFNAAIAQTGDISAQTSGSILKTADAIGGATNNASKAKDILLELAANGQVGAKSFAAIGQAAFDMAQLTGESAKDAAANAAKLFDGTAAGAVKANEQYHFLTLSVYDQIAALEKEGDAQGAAQVAATAFHDAIGPRIDEMKDQVGGIAKAWDTVTSSWRGFKADFLNGAQLIAGTADLQTQIYALQGQKAGAQSGNPLTFASFSGADQAKLDALQKQLSDQTAKADQRASDQRVQDAGVAGQAALDGYLKQYRSDETKRQDEVIAIHNAANAAITAALAKGDAKLAQQIMENEASASAAASVKGVKKPAKAKQDPDYYTSDRAQIEGEIEGEAKLFDQRTRATAAMGAYADGLQELITARANDIKLQVQSYGLGAKEATQQAQLNQITTDAARKRLQLVHDMNASTSDDTKAMYANELASLDDYTARRTAQEIQGFKDIDAARADWSNGAKGGYADILEDGKNVAGMTHDVFVNAYDGMADSLTNFETTGKLKFKSFTTSVLSDLAKMETRIAISQALQAVFGGGTSSAGGSMASVFDGGFSGFAKGDVFDSPSLAQYKNQVVSKPTMFAFAKGGSLGVMGEAGHEAIMPLARDSSGSLGVKALGGSSDMGGVNVNVSVVVNSDGSAQTDVSGNQVLGKQFGDAMANAAKKVVAQEIRPGGQIYAALGRH